MASVRAVLWDADGVLQRGPSDWHDAFGEALGDRAVDVGRELFGGLDLDAALRGDYDMREHVVATLARHDLAEVQEQVLSVWRRIEPLPESRELVAELAVPSYLATNQDTLRAACMRELMGYDELLDGAYYSCDLGVAKPDQRFWALIAEALGLAPAELVFVDDLLDNVVAARDLGLCAVHWHHDDSVPALRDALAVLGVDS
ncbi:HAD-IA family hydrolase [Nocardioides aequoreus]|uniref:HAD-IA family hydrolase n=1 Tax=Nocardioides aequoreus TaxID=397278 RepID=UPI0004C37910|nr:HAD-IA family hydrolase [Nocardioides aequoreus]